MAIEYTFDLDVVPGGIPIVVPLKQYEDNVKLKFKLYARVGSLDIPSGTTVAIRGTKPDGNGISIDASISGTTVTVNVKKQMTAAAGKSPYELVLSQNSKEFITASFMVDVQRAALDKDTLKSGSVIKELVNVVDRTDELIAAANKTDNNVTEVRTLSKQVDEQNSNVNTKAAEVDRKAELIAQLKTDADTIATQALEKATNAENEVADNQTKLDSMTDTDNMLKLALEGKVDGAFVENGYLYLTSNNEVVAGPLGPFSGTGGGGSGGSGGNNAELTVANSSGWLSTTIAKGDTCPIKVTWYSTEDGLATGNGVMKITVNGAVKAILDISQGEVTVDVSKYLATGANVVKVNVADIYSNNRTINFSITAVEISISSSFDASIPYTGPISFPYTPVGSVAKTIHFILDGTEIGTKETSVSGRQQSFTITQQSHGAHKLKCYFDCEINGKLVKSNELYYEILCLEVLNDTTIVTSSFNKTEVSQYTTLNIPYMVYDPLNLTAAVTLSVNGAVVSEQTVDRTEQVWSYRADSVGSLNLKIESNGISKTFVLTVTESEVNVEAETEALSLYLSSYGRSNNEANPSEWKYNDIFATLSNFNFVSDGWQTDDDGITVLRVNGDARVDIPANIFGSDFRATGKTIEVEFATRDVRNYNTVIMSCMSGGRGLELTAQKVMLKSEQSEVSTQYKEDEHVRISFVIEKRTASRLILCYIDGVISGAALYPVDDDFSQTTPVGISIGSSDCTTDIYCIRVYDNDLTRNQILDNWIADTQSVETMLERYQRNDVYDEYGNIVIAKLPNDTPYLVLEATELPQYKGDKKTVNGYYVDPVHPSKSFTFENAQIDVQGTSSQYYKRKNYKIKFKGGFILTDGTNVSVYKMRDDSIGTDTFTFKADVASSEGCNNVELVRLYEECAHYLNVLTPPQKENSSVRQGIDGFPIVTFWDNGTDISFLGKYNFNNDKGTEEVFGFEAGDESWETLSNTSQLSKFKTNVFGPNWAEEDFEGRFPDKNTDNTILSQMVNWLYSTDQDAATGEALASQYIDIDGGTHTVDNAAYRLAKFKTEFEDHFDIGSSTLYYLFTFVFLMVDSRQKNAFPTYWADTQRWTWLPYDMDTALGINNRGALAFGYNLEDIDMDGDDYVFNGQDSVMWVNFRQAFFTTKVKEMYQTLRSAGVISYDHIDGMFDEHQSKWPAAIFNEDTFFKHLQPLIEEGDGSYLPMAQGDKKLQRKWWLHNRLRYTDSEFVAGDALTQYIMIRPYYNITAEELAAGAVDLTIVPYANIYASVSFDATNVQVRAEEGAPTVIKNPLSYANDAVLSIYSADQIADIGDVSPLHIGYGDFSRATRLQRVKVGDSAASYVNDKLATLTFGSNTLLSYVNAANCTKLAQPIDLSGCKNIEEVYFDGTIITGITLPNGGVLRALHIPETVTNLTIRNQGYLIDFVMPSYANISTLRLENVNTAVDSLTILKAIAEGSRVRLIGIDWSFDSINDALAVYDILDTMRGLDESGNNVDKAQVSGIVRVSDITGAQLAEMQSRYPNINVVYDNIVSYLYFYNEDGSSLLQTIMCVNGADGSYTGSTPTKASTAQYAYTFAGWSKTKGGSVDSDALKAITADRSVYAVFTATVRTYTVRFYNGSTLLQTVSNVPYGSSATYTGSAPEKGEPDYEFTGFKPDGKNITGNTDCYAQYKYTGYISVKLVERTISGDYVNETVTSIGIYAFYSCSNLTTVNFPAATSIGDSAFNNCSNLTTVNFPAATSIGDRAFNSCPNLTTVNFPAAKSIGNNAFYRCSNLTTVNFPAATSIGDSAFNKCPNLTTVILRSETMCKLLYTSAFSNTPIKSGTGYIYVPTALVDTYKAATNWSTYANQIRAIEDYPDIYGGE